MRAFRQAFGRGTAGFLGGVLLSQGFFAYALDNPASDAQVVQTLKKAQAMIRQLSAERQELQNALANEDAENRQLRMHLQELESVVESLKRGLGQAQSARQRL